MKKVYVALLAYNHYELTLLRLYELMRHCAESVECVYVINNGSTDDTHEGLKWWKSGNTKLKVKEIPLDTNVGFLLGANKGLQTIIKAEHPSPDDILVLLSNDVQISGNFIPEMLEVTNDYTLTGGRYLFTDTGWNNFNGKIFPYLEGWMLAATVDGWKRLNFFDESFAPNDYEDIDLSTTAIELNYDLEVVGVAELNHLGGGTLGYTNERLAQTYINKEKFKKKWVK